MPIRLDMKKKGQPKEAPPNMLEAALEHLRAGRSIIPVCSPIDDKHCHHHKGECESPGKMPLTKWRPYQTRLPTEAEVRFWFDTWPTMNIGMVTGAISNTVVLDGDSDAAIRFALGQGEGELADAPMTTTGKGGHWYLKHPGVPVQNFAHKWPMLDFRGEGGYVVLPPSLHKSGNRYTWHGTPDQMNGLPDVPPWLMAALKVKGQKAERQAGEAAPRDDDGGDGPLDYRQFVDGVPEGARNDHLWSLACSMQAKGTDIELAKLAIIGAAERCNPPFEVDVALEMVERAYATYPEPAPLPYIVDDDEEDETEIAPEEGTDDEDEREEYGWTTASDLVARFANDDGSENWLVEGLLVRSTCHWWYSDPYVGKTIVAVKLAMHVATGEPLGEREVEQGPVLIVSEDTGLEIFADYLAKVARGLELNLADVPITVNNTEGLSLTSREGRDIVKQAIREYQPKLLILDSCEKLVPSEKWNSAEHQYLVDLIKYARKSGCALIVIDHTNKAKAAGGGKPDPGLDRIFGGRVKSATTDHAVEFSGNLNEGGIKGTWVKKRGRPGVHFQCLMTDLGGALAFELPPIVSRKNMSQSEKRVFEYLDYKSRRQQRQIVDVMAALSMPERTAKRALTSLHDKGLIKREMVKSDKGRVALYRVPSDDEILVGRADDDDDE